MQHFDPSGSTDRRSSEPAAEHAFVSTLTCGECATVNPSMRKFCAGCGTSLQDACPHCGMCYFSGEKFCGSCGVNLAAAVQQTVEKFEANLSAVEQFRSEDRYDEALSLLEPMIKAGHSRLAHYAVLAGQLMRQLMAERERRRAVAETAFHEGQRLLGENQHDRAAEVLEAVPGPLRDDRFCSLLTEASTHRQEVAGLGDGIRQAVAANRLADAMSMLGRLLELRPGDDRNRKLAEQLRQRFCRAAEEKLAEGHFEDALRLLKNVPPSLRGSSLTDRFGRAAEWAQLGHNLRTAPVVDAGLMAMGARLRELVPTDAQSVKLVDELCRRWNRVAEKCRDELPPWAAAPQQTVLGFPIDFAPPLRRIALAQDFDQELLGAWRGRFAVACGLALQGLGKAQVNINLLPTGRLSGLNAINQLLKRGIMSAWGLDLGSTSVKAVRLSWDAKEKRVVLEAAVCLEFRKSLNHAVNAIEQQALVEEALAELLAKQRLKGSRLVVGLPGRFTILKQLSLPATDPTKLAAMVEHEVPRQVPLPLSELTWGHQVLESLPASVPRSAGNDRQGISTVPVLFCGARRELVAKHLEVMDRSGIRVDLAQSECIALHNLWVYESATSLESGVRPNPYSQSQPVSPAVRQPIALLDLGGDGGSLVVSSPHSIWIRPLGFGGHIVTRTLVKELGITVAQAGQFKRNPALAPSVNRFFRSVEAVLPDLLQEIELHLEAFAKSRQYEPIVRMFGMGGEFQLHGLLRYLRAGRL
jgi:type IV pilus assembly protein PilM